MATFVWLEEIQEPPAGEQGLRYVRRLVNMDHVVKTLRREGEPDFTQLYLRDGPVMRVTEAEATIAGLLAAYGVSPPARPA